MTNRSKTSNTGKDTADEHHNRRSKTSSTTASDPPKTKAKVSSSSKNRNTNTRLSSGTTPTTPTKTKSKDKRIRSHSSSNSSPLVKDRTKKLSRSLSDPDVQLFKKESQRRGRTKRRSSSLSPSNHRSSSSSNNKKRGTTVKKERGSNGSLNHNNKQKSKSSSTKKDGSYRPYLIPIKHQLSSDISTPILKPASTLHQALSRISVASFLRHEGGGNGSGGIPVNKVSHNHPGQQHRRNLSLSTDHCSLLLAHGGLFRKTKYHVIDVADILDWHSGVVATRAMEEYCLLLATKDSKSSSSKNVHHKDNRDHSGGGGGGDSGSNDNTSAVVALCIPSIVSIFYRNAATGKRASLDLLIDNPDHRRAVVATLDLVARTYRDVTPLIGNETLLMRYIWKDIDINNDNKVNEREFLSLCHRHHFYAPDDAAKQFRSFCKDHHVIRNELSYSDCMHLLQLLKGRTVAMDAWKTLFGSTATTVDAKTLMTTFLHGPQKESKTCDLQDAIDLITTMNATELDNYHIVDGGSTNNNNTHSTRTSSSKLLSRPQFEEFLRSRLNDAYDPSKRLPPTRPLIKPISHYWINASYNTYLLGASSSDRDPSSSASSSTSDFESSSIEAYTHALARGCRYIELDCWDGPTLPDGECVPMIYHQCPGFSSRIGKSKRGGSKRSLGRDDAVDDDSQQQQRGSTKITFRSVIFVIVNYLKANPTTYPIILSLENHCSRPYQKAMAKLMKNTFGSRLFIPASVHRTKELPSPEELVGMIVVKGKKPSSHNGGVGSVESCSRTNLDPYADMFKKFDAPVKPESKRIQSFLPDQTILSSPLLSSKHRKKKGGSSGGAGGGLGAGPGMFDKRDDDDDMPKYDDELLAVTLFFDAEFSGFFEDSMDLLPSHNHSIGDTKVAKVAAKYETNPKLWREFNETHCKVIPERNKKCLPIPFFGSRGKLIPILVFVKIIVVSVHSNCSDTDLPEYSKYQYQKWKFTVPYFQQQLQSSLSLGDGMSTSGTQFFIVRYQPMFE
jgi:hypothetical protein